MATDTTEIADASIKPEESLPATPSAADAVQPPQPAKAESGAEPLPPRIDAGENADEVLGEVSKLFGQVESAKPTEATHADDDINETLNDLTAAGAPPEKVAAPAEPSKEMRLGTAADLFRSSPAEPDEAPVSEAPLEHPTVEPTSTVPKTNASPPSAPGKPTKSLGLARMMPLRRVLGRLPSRARIPVAVAAAVLLGLVAVASLTRSRTHEAAHAVAAEKHHEEKATQVSVSPESKESTAKVAALEEQLQQALAERSTAQKERQEAVAQLKFLEAQAQSKKHDVHAEVEQEQTARRKVEVNYQSAEQQIHLLELRTYDVQLARVRETWRQNPGLALTLLDDQDRCPARLRDFTWGYFHGRAKNDRATIAAHSGRVNAVAWSPDGKAIASCGQDGFVKMWDAESGKEIASLVAHAGGATAIAFSARGELLATAGADGTVKLWDVASRKITATYYGHLKSVRSVAISPDAASLVSASDDGTLRFWDVVSRKATATRWGRPQSREPSVDDPTQAVRSIAWSPDSLLVASGGYQVVRLWDATSATAKTMLSVPEGTVTALAFSPQGKTLAAGTDGAIYRWDVESLVPRSLPVAVEGRVNGLRYSADGRQVAAATDHGAILFHERADGARGEMLRLEGHLGAVTGIAFSPSGEAVVTSGDDGTLRLWNPEAGAIDKIDPDVVLRCRRPAVAIAYSPDGKRFAAGGSDAITIWNTSDGVETATLKSRSGEITNLAFSPDGTRLASASKDWPILLWDLASQRVTAAFNGHTNAVNSVRFSSDSKILISASDDGTVRTWNVAAAQEQTRLAGHAAAALCAVVSPDGKLAASGGADHSVRLWDLAQKRLLATLAGHQAPIVSLAISPDGRHLASVESLPAGTVSSDATHRPIRLWRLPKGEMAHEFGTPGSFVHGVVFSPDGKTLATSDRDGVTLWNAETGERRETLRSPDVGRLSPLVFSPNGLTLATGGESAIVFWTASEFASKP
jgi:WD40 repeat protein